MPFSRLKFSSPIRMPRRFQDSPFINLGSRPGTFTHDSLSTPNRLALLCSSFRLYEEEEALFHRTTPPPPSRGSSICALSH